MSEELPPKKGFFYTLPDEVGRAFELLAEKARREKEERRRATESASTTGKPEIRPCPACGEDVFLRPTRTADLGDHHVRTYHDAGCGLPCAGGELPIPPPAEVHEKARCPRCSCR